MKDPKQMLSRLTLVASLACSLSYVVTPSVVQAEPVFGQSFEVSQPDGTVLTVKIWGDEYYRRVESLDGYTLIKDPDTGWICYARLAADGQSLESTGIVYQQTSNGSNGTYDVSASPFDIQPGLTLPANVIEEKVRQAKTELLAPMLEAQSENGVLLQSEQVVTAAAAEPEIVQGLTILIDFEDDQATFTQQDIDDLYNQVGYNRYNNNGSVRDYFYDVSNGQFTYTNHVTAYYRAQHPKTYYTDETVAFGERARELITEALNWLETEQNFDFSTLSVKSGNDVRALNVMYTGARQNAWAKGLWPHRSSLSGFSADGVDVRDYQITDISSLLSIGTIVHENGHMLFNWPDLYDHQYDSKGTGSYALMGNYGSSLNPVPPNAAFRAQKNWDTVIDISADLVGQTVSIDSNSNHSYRYMNPFDNTEAFYIESRQKTARSQHLPDEGLLIWHAANGNNGYQDRTCERHYGISVVQSDGLFDLENNVNYGDVDDLFDANSVSEFNDDTTPSAHWWCNGPSGLSISQISAIGPTMSFQINESYALKQTKSGWPQSVLAEGETFWAFNSSRSPTFVDLDNDGRQEVVSYSDQNIYAWDSAGQLLSGFPIVMPDRTFELLTFADLDGNGDQEIVAFIRGNANNVNTVYAYNRFGAAMQGFPAGDSVLMAEGAYFVGSDGNPVVAVDVDQDGDDELLVGLTQSSPSDNNFAHVVLLNGDGSFMPGWPLIPAAAYANRSIQQFAAADLTGDGDIEILVVTAGNSTQTEVIPPSLSIYNADGSLESATLLAEGVSNVRDLLLTDFDQDGQLEIALIAMMNTSTENGVFVLDSAGQALPNWPQMLPMSYSVKLSVADIVDNRTPELLVRYSSKLAAYDQYGQLKTGFPKAFSSVQVVEGNFLISSNVMGVYFDGDDKSSLFVSSNKGLHAFNANLESIGFWSFQNGLMSNTTATVGDIDNDGILEVAGIESSGLVKLYELPNTVNQDKVSIWPMDRANAKRTRLVTSFNAGDFAHIHPQVYFRGTPNGFATDRLMTLVDDYLWEIEVSFSADPQARFKFDVKGDWTQDYGDNNADNYVDAGGADIFVTEGEGDYRIRYNDQTGYYSVTKIIGNQAPIAEAGDNVSIEIGATVQFDGSASTDPDGSIVDYVWHSSVFPTEGLSGVSPSFTFNDAGSYDVTLTVTDNEGKQGSDVMTVQVGQVSTWARTVIFIYGQTQSGQDMFIRGGIDHGYANTILGRNCQVSNFECAIPIQHNNLLNGTTAPWKAGDEYLDWYGHEAAQSTQAEGTALDWTTDVWPASWGTARTVAVDGYGVTPLNTFGQHYWMLDVQMDCSKTVNGWFELKSYISNGPSWEGDVSQPDAPYASGNHFAECGKLNVFRRGESNPVTITDLN